MADLVDADENVLRVSARTPPQDLAAAIAHACYERNPPVIRAIGAGAVNQANKGIAIATQYVAGRAMRLTTMMGFDNVTLDGRVVSAMRYKIFIDD